MIRILLIIIVLASTISVDAQNEVVGVCVKKDGVASGITLTPAFIAWCSYPGLKRR